MKWRFRPVVEEWKTVPGYEGLYEVSNLGNARSLARVDAQGGRRRQRTLKPSRMDIRGHRGIKLRRDGVVKSRYVHQLVLEAFIGPCPDGLEACHWNDVPDDNRLENLRWATKSANRHDCVRIYAGRRHCMACQRIADSAFRARRSSSQRKAA